MKILSLFGILILHVYDLSCCLLFLPLQGLGFS